MKNSYTVNYVAFTKHLEQIIKYLKENKLIETSETIVDSFPGQLVDLLMPKLPTLNTIKLSDVFEISKRQPFTPCETFLRIQKHVLENRVRVHEFLEPFDRLKCGLITKNQFLRALDNIGLSALNRLVLTEREMEIVCALFRDPIDSDRIRWKDFEDEVDKVFTQKHMHKLPNFDPDPPPGNIVRLPRVGAAVWQCQPPITRDLLEETMEKIKTKIRNRRIYFLPFFKDMDKFHMGHVSPSQAKSILFTNNLYVSDEEFDSLLAKYYNDLGFNYVKFLEDADEGEYALPKVGILFVCFRKNILGKLLITQFISCLEASDGPLRECHPKPVISQQDLIDVLAKIKKQMLTKSLRIVDFLRDFDRHRKGEIREDDFRRGVDNSGIKISPREMDIVCEM